MVEVGLHNPHLHLASSRVPRRLALCPCLLVAIAALGAEAAEPVEVTLGQSVAGRPIIARVYGDGPETVLILASIHGSEPAGTPQLACAPWAKRAAHASSNCVPRPTMFSGNVDEPVTTIAP